MPNVNFLGEMAFWRCEGLESISISESLLNIRSSTFYGCIRLTDIIIPKGVSSIGNESFKDCSSLRNIKLESENTEIFDNEYTIPAETQILGYSQSTAKDYAFKYNRNFKATDIIGNTDITGLVEFKAISPVKSDKEWTITFSGIVDEKSVPGNIYVTNDKGFIQATTCDIFTKNGLSAVKVIPDMSYEIGNYTLWVRGVESTTGIKIKNSVYLNFKV